MVGHKRRLAMKWLPWSPISPGLPSASNDFRYEDEVYEADQDADEMTTLMKALYVYNKIINEVPESTGGTEAQKKSLAAEAKAGRAWCYFLLINYYGKPYQATTAASDAGYPIITEADVTAAKFERASVKAVWDFIVNDLTEAIPDLPAQNTHRLRMSRPAAQGLLGKVYMFMGKFSEAQPLLDAAMTGITATPIPVRLYDYNVTFATGGAFLPIGLFGPTYPTTPNNEENMYARQFGNPWSLAANELVLTPQTVALYGTTDLRRKFMSATPYPSGAAFPNGMMRRSGPTTAQMGFLVPDLYLLRAECRARLGDLAGAKTDVEALRVKRMPAADAPVPSNVAADQVQLVKFILEERLREFAGLGYRWFDMRRLSVDPTYASTVGYKHYQYATSGAATEHTLRPERLTLRLPRKVMEQNPGMQNNQ